MEPAYDHQLVVVGHQHRVVHRLRQWGTLFPAVDGRVVELRRCGCLARWGQPAGHPDPPVEHGGVNLLHRHRRLVPRPPRRGRMGTSCRYGQCCDEVGGCGVSGFGGAADGVEGVADGGDPEAVAARVEGGQGGPGGVGGAQVVGLDGAGDAGGLFAADDDELAVDDGGAGAADRLRRGGQRWSSGWPSGRSVARRRCCCRR